MQKTQASSAKSGSKVGVHRRSGLAGIYIAPRNLDQLGAFLLLLYHQNMNVQ
jgi:hypothetical protein